jgi:hypothetical protein
MFINRFPVTVVIKYKVCVLAKNDFLTLIRRESKGKYKAFSRKVAEALRRQKAISIRDAKKVESNCLERLKVFI